MGREAVRASRGRHVALIQTGKDRIGSTSIKLKIVQARGDQFNLIRNEHLIRNEPCDTAHPFPHTNHSRTLTSPYLSMNNFVA